MRLNFRKISAVLASSVMSMSGVAFAAAASWPMPFVEGGSADVAIVYGTGEGVSSLDIIQAGNIQSNLQSSLGGTPGTPTTITGGDSLLIAKSSDNLNLGDTWGVFTGTVDDDDLGTLLADGTFVAEDNDDFDYEQKITLGSPTFEHFRDSDYEEEVGLSDKTPTLGFKISSNTFIMNYTLDFTQDAESTVTGGDLDDIEGADLPLMGRTYFVSDMDNSTLQLELLDSANVQTVSEGETVTVESGGNSYEVSISFIDADEVKFLVNGQTVPTASKLSVGETSKLADGAYIGVRDISKLEVSGELGQVTFSIGTGKLEITTGSDVKLNDEDVDGVKGYVTRGTASGDTQKIDKIVLEWITDDEEFLTPESELVMPGFEAVKFTMADFMRPSEEEVTIEPDGDDSMQMTVPIKDGSVSFNFLYANSTGEFKGIGKDANEQLATSNGTTLTYQEKDSSAADVHEYFVASYAITQEAESYLLRAKVDFDSTNSRNEVTIDKRDSSGWTQVCEEKIATDTCDIGDVSLTITTIGFTSGGAENVTFTAGTDVVFDEIYTTGGLKIYLPFLGMSGSSVNGEINFTDNITLTAGHSLDSFYLFMDGEDKDDNIGSGVEFNFTINDNSDGNLQVQEVNNAGTAGPGGIEQEDTSTYEAYIVDEVAPRILHFTNPDEDYAQVFYPTGDSESYAEVFLSEESAMITSGASGTTGTGGTLGEVLVKDTEVASVTSKNLVIVGGTCINSAAATALGVSARTCGSAFTDATGVGSGQFLLKGVDGAFTTGKLALVVAGYEAADTVNAAKFLTTQTVDTDGEYLGTSSTSATMVTSEA